MKNRNSQIVRLEFNGLLRSDDPMVEELLAEAGARGVSMQQHIFDILRARHLKRHGRSLDELLWTPGLVVAEGTAVEPEVVQEDVTETNAREAASAWADML